MVSAFGLDSINLESQSRAIENDPVLIHDVAAEQDVGFIRMGQNLHQVRREIPDRQLDEVGQDQP